MKEMEQRKIGMDLERDEIFKEAALEWIRDFMVFLCRTLSKRLVQATWTVFDFEEKELGEHYQRLSEALCGYEVNCCGDNIEPPTQISLIPCRKKEPAVLCVFIALDGREYTVVEIKGKDLHGGGKHQMVDQIYDHIVKQMKKG